MEPIIVILFWLLALVATGAAVLLRSFNETPVGTLCKKLADSGLPEDLDEREKLHRIGVTLTLIFQLSRGAWVGLLFWWWLGSPWFGPEILSSSDGTTGSGGDHTWLAVVNLGVVQLVLAVLLFELVPQVISSYRGDRIATASLHWLWRLDTLLSPFSRSFRVVRRALLRLVGNGKERTEAEAAEQGIRAAVELGEREGVLLEGEKSMIESLLEFHDADVAEVMTPRTDMVCFEASRSIGELLPEVIACGHSRIPVYRENIDDIVAVLYVKDLLRFVSDREKRALEVEKAARPANFVPETKKLSELLAEFRSERFHIAIILDEYGGTAGLVTIEDILEEIVGEIEDEYDRPEPQALIQRVDDDTFELDGRARIDEVSDAIGQPLPESDDYETVAGLIFCSLGKVPKVGEALEFENVRFEVTTADERKIKHVRVRLLHPTSQDLEQA